MFFPCPKPIPKPKKTKNYIRHSKQGSFASLERKANSVWSKRVLKRDGYRCRIIMENGDRCNAPAHEAHHIIRRWYKAVKFNPDDGLAICQFHHREDVRNLKENTIRTVGQNEIDRLRKLAYTGAVPETEEDLRKIIERLVKHEK